MFHTDAAVSADTDPDPITKLIIHLYGCTLLNLAIYKHHTQTVKEIFFSPKGRNKKHDSESAVSFYFNFVTLETFDWSAQFEYSKRNLKCYIVQK